MSNTEKTNTVFTDQFDAERTAYLERINSETAASTTSSATSGNSGPAT